MAFNFLQYRKIPFSQNIALFLEKFTPLAKIFTLPAAVTAVTNFTSVPAIQKFSSQPATFQTIRKFPNRLEIFRTIWKLFRQSSNFSDHPETFQTIHTVSRPSSNFPDHSETFQCIFKGYTQKLFEYAKTQMAMPLCHTGFGASALLLFSSLIVDHPCHSCFN